MYTSRIGFTTVVDHFMFVYWLLVRTKSDQPRTQESQLLQLYECSVAFLHLKTVYFAGKIVLLLLLLLLHVDVCSVLKTVRLLVRSRPQCLKKTELVRGVLMPMAMWKKQTLVTHTWKGESIFHYVFYRRTQTPYWSALRASTPPVSRENLLLLLVLQFQRSKGKCSIHERLWCSSSLSSIDCVLCARVHTYNETNQRTPSIRHSFFLNVFDNRHVKVDRVVPLVKAFFDQVVSTEKSPFKL